MKGRVNFGHGTQSLISVSSFLYVLCLNFILKAWSKKKKKAQCSIIFSVKEDGRTKCILERATVYLLHSNIKVKY